MYELRGPTRTAFLGFFISHIPITLIIDSQSVLPASIYPIPIQQTLRWYASTFNDKLMTPPYSLFLQTFVACELLFQMPFFFVATYALLNSREQVISGSGWFRTACIIYGTHTSTTLFPILASLVFDKELAASEKALLFGFYMPYLIFPAWLVLIASVSKNVFGENENKNK